LNKPGLSLNILYFLYNGVALLFTAGGDDDFCAL
jgi:hypothetical protein